MILHVIDTLNRGGAERVLVDLTGALVPLLNERIGVCTTRVPGVLATEVAPNVRHFTLNRIRRWDWGALKRFRALLVREQVRIVHVHSRSTLTFVAAAVFMQPIRPLIVMHDHFGGVLLPPRAQQLFRHLVRRYADHYVCVSEALRDWAITSAELPDDCCTVINNGVPISRFPERISPHAEGRQRRLQGVLVANLRAEKNHEALVRAMASSADLQELVELHFIGGGDRSDVGRKVRTLVRELGLESSIKFFGSIDQVATAVHDADFGIVASSYEAGPVVALEYMAAGRPYATTPVGNIYPVALKHGCCVTARGTTSDDLAHMLRRMCQLTAEERANMGVRGRALVEARYSLELQAEQVRDIYIGLAKRVA
jgi:glycosyltransferase involved in cell wall biosynthesis